MRFSFVGLDVSAEWHACIGEAMIDPRSSTLAKMWRRYYTASMWENARSSLVIISRRVGVPEATTRCAR